LSGASSAAADRSWDAVVVGSGIGGLVAGGLLARGGKRVLVLERNASFGGAASVYRVGDLTIEASLHELDGLDEDDVKLPILRRLGVTEGVEFVEVGDLYEVRSPLLGEPFVMPAGLDAGIEAVSQRFPGRASAIRAYFARLVKIRNVFTLVGRKRGKRLWWIVNAPLLPWRFRPLLRDGRRSLGDVLRMLFGDDEALKVAVGAHFPYYSDDPERLWFPFWAVAQGSYHRGGAHYPRGGSKRLADHLLGVIRDAGGAAEAGRRVTRIILDDGRVAGVVHEASAGGERLERAPVVFGNAAPQILSEALPPDARTAFLARYEGRSPSTSLFTLALGLDRRPTEFGIRGHSTSVFPDWLRSFGDFVQSGRLLAEAPGPRLPPYILVDYTAADTGLTPTPPYLATVSGVDRLANWEGLDESAYRDRRERWAEALVGALEREFPGIAGAIVQRELTTARSVASYLGTPGGAVYGFATEPPAKGRVLPSLERTSVPGLYLASAWTRFGGYTGSIMGGALAAGAAARDAAKR
jgi:phytoene dehydrogenase-like protein